MYKGHFKLISILVLLCLALSSCGIEHYFRTSNQPNVLFPSIPKGVEQKNVAADVHVQQNASDVPLVSAAVAGENLLMNPGFEEGINDWGSCGDVTDLQPSTDAYEGLQSMMLSTGCFYQSVQVSAGQDISFSCQSKVANATGWSGMGLSFADSDWNTTLSAPSQTISGMDYREYATTETAPANTKYASIWAYSDGSLNIDDCKVYFGEPAAPSGNLLLNPNFDVPTTVPANWQSCGAEDNFNLDGNLNLTGLTCLYQTVNARANLNYTLNCTAKYDGTSWSSMILSTLDENWQAITEEYMQIDTTDFTEKTLTAETSELTRHVAVTFYNEGQATYESCSLTATSTGGTPDSPTPDTPDPNGPNASSLVGHWTFDETSGTTANDSSSYNNTATVENGGWAAGKVANALSMNGGDDSIVRIPLSDSLRSTSSNITVMAWGYRTANHNVALISHGYPDLFFGYHGPQYKWQFRNQDGTFAACYAGNAPLNEWQHLAATFDGSTAVLYANGIEICSRPLSGTIPMAESDFLISGYINGGGQIIDEITGKIDDVRIYNEALSQSDIEAIYQATNP